MPRSYVPTIAETLGAEDSPSVAALIDSYGYGAVTDDVIALIDEAAVSWDFDAEFDATEGGDVIA